MSMIDTLFSAFQNPPASTRPWVYWYWISGCISKEGITRDLEEMARLGIGEACIGNVDINPDRRGPIDVLSDEFWAMKVHAVQEGARLGVAVSSFNAPGWSQSGGPWIGPEDAMKHLVVRSARVRGEEVLDIELPKPDGWFEDVAILALPAAASPVIDFKVRSQPAMEGVDRLLAVDNEADMELRAPQIGATVTIDFVAEHACTIRGIRIRPGRTAFLARARLLAGTTVADLKLVGDFTVDRSFESLSVGPQPWAPVAVGLPVTTACHFRLELVPDQSKKESTSEPPMPGALYLRGVELLPEPVLDRYVEKQLAKLQQTPIVPWDTYMWAPQVGERGGIPIKKVIDLSENTLEGRLQAKLPPGDWDVLRVTAELTGTVNAPAAPEATGLEVDKMSRKAVALHLTGYVDQLLKRVPKDARGAIRHVIADSFETGSQNWTSGFRDLFRETYGYDLVPWLPVLVGRIVENAERSDAFLWDVRRLVADRIASEYVGGMRAAAHERGLRMWLENYGHWGFPAEFLQYGGASDEIAGEFWTPDPLIGDFWRADMLGDDEMRAASSAGHIYNKQIISAESFTAGGSIFVRSPWMIKTRADWAQTIGINHFLLHVYVHQPDEFRPGVTTWFGTEFNRHTPWFPQAQCWIGSFRRAHALLQQGQHIADVAYFIGEDTPKMAGICDPALPPGYDFDFINAEVIRRDLDVVDGWFVLPHGKRYRVLVLPPQNTMRPELLQRLAELVQKGGIIVGPQPLRSPSLAGQPEADRIVEKLGDDLWAGASADSVEPARHSDGRVYLPGDMTTILDQLELPPDLENPGPLLWTHRQVGDDDIYFLANPGDETVSVSPKFRARTRGSIEWWDEVNGAVYQLRGDDAGGFPVTVPLEFGPRESGFVVFRPEPTALPGGIAPLPVRNPVLEAPGPWHVTFDPIIGPAGPVDFEHLIDWREHPDQAVANYAGQACYESNVELTADQIAAIREIEIGVYHGIASVEINGALLGNIWVQPGRIAVGGALRAGTNMIRITLWTPWINRVSADLELPEHERVLQINGSLWLEGETRDVSPRPTGIIGPVVFQRFTERN